ncbi:MAG: DUF2194 domain-containing protein [Anaerolineaceae bacterium]|nr:DUF2194 domain-containing protein [Anaerolineaceae bacterium]
MRRKIGFSWLFLPLSVLIFLAFALFVERSGIPYTHNQTPSNFLEPISTLSNTGNDEKHSINSDCLVLYDSTSTLNKGSLSTVTAALDSMKVPYYKLDINQSSQIDFQKYKTVIITFIRLSRIDQQIEQLMDWVENGGKLLFAIRPDNSATLSRIYPQVGISALSGEEMIGTTGVEFLTELLPGTAGMQFGLDFLEHNCLPVDLKENVKVHLISADGLKLPILWETDSGRGKVVFVNSDQFITKDSRGLIGAAYSLLQEVTIYPVINASVFFIDDYPSPIPEGRDETIFKQFNRDIKSFYKNIWLPDVMEIKDKYNIKITGVIIETYEYTLQPPFEYTANQADIFKFFGGIVLRDGGQIGLHGYNHVPLCKKEDGFNQVLDYPVWSSTLDMQRSILELQRLGSSMLPGQPFEVYVPPSNMLCPEARAWLPKVLPDLKVIASVYLPDANVPAYVQEYTEAEDGIIELPRIVSGYNPDNYMRWVAANEIWLHYVAAHFVHPDDVLDSYRNNGESWTELRKNLDEYLLWVYSSMPTVRNMTASEGAMAVQRYVRLTPKYDCDNRECRITLDGFYDEGWLLMRTENVPITITNGEFTQVSPNLYLIKASAANILIGFEE